MGFGLRPITSYTDQNELLCLLCDNLPTPKNGLIKDLDDDLVQITLSLKKLKWGDGTPFSAKDIYFTWQIGKDPLYGHHLHSFYTEDIQDIEIINDQKVIITRRKNSHNPADLSDFWIMPAHLEKRIYKAHPKDYLQHSLYHIAPNTPGLYLGPYTISHFDPFGKITYAPNPHWPHQANHSFPSISLTATGDINTLKLRFEANQFDVIPAFAGLTTAQSKTYLKTKENLIMTVPALGQELILFNLDTPLLQDKNLRKALYEAIDKELIFKSLYHEKGEIATGFRSSFEDNNKPSDTPEDPLSLLKQAGWTLDPTTKRLMKDNRPLELDLILPAGNQLRNNLAQILQDMWAQLGIKVNLITQPPKVFFGKTLKERNFNHFILFGWPKTPHYIPEPMFGSKFIPSSANFYAGYNYMGYKNESVDHILRKLQMHLPPIESEKHWIALEEILTDERPFLPLFHLSKNAIVSENLKGIKINPHYYPESLFVENWGWEK